MKVHFIQICWFTWGLTLALALRPPRPGNTGLFVFALLHPPSIRWVCAPVATCLNGRYPKVVLTPTAGWCWASLLGNFITSYQPSSRPETHRRGKTGLHLVSSPTGYQDKFKQLQPYNADQSEREREREKNKKDKEDRMLTVAHSAAVPSEVNTCETKTLAVWNI